MLTLLDRYLYRCYLRTFLLVLGALAGIYLLVDFFQRMDNFVEKGLPLALAGRYFLFKVPFVAAQLAPVTIMLAGVVTVGWLVHSGEFLALQGCGLRLGRILRPVFVGALAATLGMAALAQWLLPPTMRETNRIWHQEVGGFKYPGALRGRTIFHRGRRGIYAVEFVGTAERVGRFVYTELTPDFSLARQVVAARGTAAADHWLLEDGYQKVLETDGTPRLTPFATLQLALPEPPADLFAPAYREEEQSLTTLWHRGRQAGGWQARARFHSRLAFFVLGLPLLAVGLPVLLAIWRTWRRDLVLAVPAGSAIAFAAWGGWGLLQSLAKTGAIQYIPAAWGLHFLLAAGGFFWLRRQGRR